MAIYLSGQQVAFNNILNNSSVVAQPLTVTTNGTYTASSGTAYSPVTVNVNSNTSLISSVLRSDAELINSYHGDLMMIEDKEVTLPDYSTSAKTLLASENLTPTITLSYNDYNYYVLMRMLTIPSYNIDTVAKGRYEYSLTSYLYELKSIPITLPSLVNNKTYTNDNYVTWSSMGTVYGLYWASASSYTIYNSSTYGITQLPTAPTTSNGIMTIKSPYVNSRCNSTYFSQTYYEALTDTRLQYVIEVYRAPKNHLNIDGWGASHEVQKILNNINNNNFILT